MIDLIRTSYRGVAGDEGASRWQKPTQAEEIERVMFTKCETTRRIGANWCPEPGEGLWADGRPACFQRGAQTPYGFILVSYDNETGIVVNDGQGDEYVLEFEDGSFFLAQFPAHYREWDLEYIAEDIADLREDWEGLK
jgi:hypothetical protein